VVPDPLQADYIPSCSEIHHGAESRHQGIPVLAASAGMQDILDVGLEGDRGGKADRVGELDHGLKGGPQDPLVISQIHVPAADLSVAEGNTRLVFLTARDQSGIDHPPVGVDRERVVGLGAETESQPRIDACDNDYENDFPQGACNALLGDIVR
jgi:hypothetical protein